MTNSYECQFSELILQNIIFSEQQMMRGMIINRNAMIKSDHLRILDRSISKDKQVRAACGLESSHILIGILG